MAPLSQDILDLFVDFLDNSREGRKALRTCMLVSWALFPRARSHVFSTVKLGYRQECSDMRNLIKLLEHQKPDYPPLGPCIKTLVVILRHDFLDEGFMFVDEVECKIAVLRLLSKPACKITHVEFHFSSADLLNLKSGERAYYNAIQDICSVSTLRSLRLTSVKNFPAEIIDICRLEELHLNEGGFAIPSSPSSQLTGNSTTLLVGGNPSTSTSRIREISLGSPRSLPPAWYEPSTSPFKSVRSLLIQFDADTGDHRIDMLLSIAERSLQNLVLWPTIFPSSSSSLQSLKVLRTLTFKYGLSFDYRTVLDQLAESIITILATMTDVPASLGRISIHFRVYNLTANFNSARIRLFRDDNQRRKLLDVLSGPRFTSVTYIEILFRTNFDDVAVLVDFSTQTNIEYPRIKVTIGRL